MVKLFCIGILHKTPAKVTCLKSAYDLQSFGVFQRGSVQEFILFCMKTVTERTSPASRQSIKEGDYLCHVYVRSDNLAGVVISDHEYPVRVSHTLITKILDEFTEKVPPENWQHLEEKDVNFPHLHTYLNRYQNPMEADALTKLQDQVEETKIIMHNNLEAILERGERVGELVSKSEDLSDKAKLFYKTVPKTKACCSSFS